MSKIFMEVYIEIKKKLVLKKIKQNLLNFFLIIYIVLLNKCDGKAHRLPLNRQSSRVHTTRRRKRQKILICHK